jgi:hypothetical protein
LKRCDCGTGQPRAEAGGGGRTDEGVSVGVLCGEECGQVGVGGVAPLHDLPCADTVKGAFFGTGGGRRALGSGTCGCEGKRELRRHVEVSK